MENYQGLFGIILIPAIAWALSEDKGLIDFNSAFRLLAVGLGLQLVLAIIFLRVPGATALFEIFSDLINALQKATETGMQMVFGYLAGGDQPFDLTNPTVGYILAFRALPIILVMSVLSRLLYHWGILQKIVRGASLVLQQSFGISGPLGTATAANIFVGMVEAPLLIRPYLASMSRSALFATMTAGMATTAGTVLALYASILEPVLKGAVGHLLIASIMSAPAAILLARLMVPRNSTTTSKPTQIAAPESFELKSESTMDAISTGTSDGLRLLANVAAMLIVMIALVTLANMVLAQISEPFGLTLTFQKLVGALCMPLAWVIGIPLNQAAIAGELIGTKLILNELLAYLEMSKLPEGALTERSRLILTYALCGFANLGSLGIMIGGLVSMVPERRADIIALAPKSIISGALATLMTGAIVGLIS